MTVVTMAWHGITAGNTWLPSSSSQSPHSDQREGVSAFHNVRNVVTLRVQDVQLGPAINPMERAGVGASLCSTSTLVVSQSRGTIILEYSSAVVLGWAGPAVPVHHCTMLC